MVKVMREYKFFHTIITVIIFLFMMGISVLAATSDAAYYRSIINTERDLFGGKYAPAQKLSSGEMDLSTGEVSIDEIDVRLPGKNGLDLEIHRIYSSQEPEYALEYDYESSKFDIYCKKAYVYTVMDGSGKQVPIAFPREEEMVDSFYTTLERISDMDEDDYGVDFIDYSYAKDSSGTVLLERDKSKKCEELCFEQRSGITGTSKGTLNTSIRTDNYEWEIAKPYLYYMGSDIKNDGETNVLYYRFGNERGEIYSLRFYLTISDVYSNYGQAYAPRFYGSAYEIDVLFDEETTTHTLFLKDKEGKMYTFNLGNIIKSAKSVRSAIVSDRHGNQIVYNDNEITDSYGRKLRVSSDGIEILNGDVYKYLVKYDVEEIYDEDRDPYGLLTIFTKTQLNVMRNSSALDDAEDKFEITKYITQAKEITISSKCEAVPVLLLKEVIYPEGLKVVYEYEARATEVKVPRNVPEDYIKQYKVPKVLSRSEQIYNGTEYEEKIKRTFEYQEEIATYVNSVALTVDETFNVNGNNYKTKTYTYDFADRLLDITEKIGTNKRKTEYLHEHCDAIEKVKDVDKLDYSDYRQKPVVAIRVLENNVLVDSAYMEYTRDRKPTLIQKGLQKETYAYDETYWLVTDYTKTIDLDRQIHVVNTKTDDGKNIAKTETFEVVDGVENLVRTTTYTYNSDGTVASETTTDGGTTVYSYDYSLFEDAFDGKHSVTANVTTTDAEGKSRTESTVVEYDLLGKTKKTTDGNGNTTEFKFDLMGRVIEELYPDGTKRNVIYDTVNRTITVSQPDGKKVAFEYDVYDNLIKTYLPDAGNKVLETNDYDSLQRKIGTTVYVDERNTVGEQYEYDCFDRIAKKTVLENESIIETANYARTNSIRAISFSTSSSETYALNDEYTALMIITRGTTSLNAEYSYIRVNVDGEQIDDIPTFFNDVNYRVYDMRGVETLTLVQRRSNNITMVLIKPDNLGTGSCGATTTVTTTYTGDESFVRPKEVTTYDNSGAVISAELIDNTTGEVLSRDEYDYDFLGNVKEYRDSKVNLDGVGEYTSRTEYNAFGLPTKEINAVGDYRTYTYDALGRLLIAQDETGATTSHTYDALGREIMSETAISATETAKTEKFYDMNGNVVKERIKNNKAGEAETSKEIAYEYDSMNRPVAVKTNDGKKNIYTQYAYDILGNVTMTVNGQIKKLDLSKALPDNVNATYYEYDRFGNVTKTTDANGRYETASYNLAGLPVSTTDKKGVTTTYTYNGYGSPLTVTVDGMQPIEYTYNVNNMLLQAKQGEDAVAYEYDSLGRLTKETENGIIKTYQTDKVGNITYAEIAGVGTTYTYDNLNRLTGATFEGGSATYTYDKAGRITSEAKGGISTAYTYNQAGWLTGKSNTTDGQTTSYALTYFSDGNIASKTVNGKTTNYTYDNLGQLIRENDTAYRYDTRGNRIQMTKDGVVTDYRYDRTNKLMTVNTGDLWTAYAYDENGNSISRESYTLTTENGTTSQIPVEYMTMTYDSMNRMTKAQKEGMTAEYTYGIDNMRRSKTVNGVTTKYVWDGGNIVAETDGNNAVINRYFRGVGLIASKTGDVLSYYQTDSHGDVSRWGAVDYSYDAFGNETTATAGTNPFRYNGEYQDLCSGLIYLRNRYYDPSIGRFISEDPARDGLNWYAYCDNNPVMFVDPTGYAKEGDERFSQSVRDEIAIYGQMWSDADVAYSLGIISIYEKESVQSNAERKADDIRYRADHPYKTFFSSAVEFAVFDVVLGDLNGGTVYAADLSGPALEKMYGNQENLKAIVNAAPVAVVAAVNSSSKGRTLVNTKINGKMTRVDIEFPQGGKPANLHVQIKGTGQKVMIESLDDLNKLPKAVSKNTAIINTVKKGLKLLGKLF